MSKEKEEHEEGEEVRIHVGEGKARWTIKDIIIIEYLFYLMMKAKTK